MLSFEDMARWRRLAREEERRDADRADKEEAKEKGESREEESRAVHNRGVRMCVHDGGSETRRQLEC